MKCVACNSERVRRSRRVGATERILSWFGVYPYRCLSCWARFGLFTWYKQTRVELGPDGEIDYSKLVDHKKVQK